MEEQKEALKKAGSSFAFEALRAGIWGLAVGDAMGVPAEFMEREMLKERPITDMKGGGVHGKSAGIWSDDTSMTLCLLDSLAIHGEFCPEDVMERFEEWLIHGAYTADGDTFDVGNACRQAIFRFANGMPAKNCGGLTENSNGNGSLMRILPMAYYFHAKGRTSIFEKEEDAELVASVSSLTHAHKRSILACGIYVEAALRLLWGDGSETAIKRAVEAGFAYYKALGEDWERELPRFARLADTEAFSKLPEREIRSTGYVVDTLEASLWCLLNTKSYRDCVLLAVNLGRDADTTAAVAGGLAGLLYGMDAIPEAWRNGLRNSALLEDILKRMEQKFYR